MGIMEAQKSGMVMIEERLAFSIWMMLKAPINKPSKKNPKIMWLIAFWLNFSDIIRIENEFSDMNNNSFNKC